MLNSREKFNMTKDIFSIFEAVERKELAKEKALMLFKDLLSQGNDIQIDPELFGESLKKFSSSGLPHFLTWTPIL